MDMMGRQILHPFLSLNGVLVDAPWRTATRSPAAAAEEGGYDYGGSGEDRPDVKMRGRSTDRGSGEIIDPTDPGIGGSGGRVGQAPCWENITAKCSLYKAGTRLRKTGRLLPVGDFKLGTVALNWNEGFRNQFGCGSGPYSIAHGEELDDGDTRVDYFRTLKNLGFSEIAISLPQWECGEVNTNVYVRDIQNAINGGFRCSEIQVSIPGQVCQCLEDGSMSEDTFEGILDEIKSMCQPDTIMGVWVDEPEKDENVNCRARLSYFNRVTTERDIPLFLSGYYTAILDTGNTGTIDDLVKQYATGGVSYTGYSTVFEGNLLGESYPIGWLVNLMEYAYESKKNLPFRGWDELINEFEDERGDDFILFPWANPVYDHYNEYLQEAKKFERLYLFPGDIFYGNPDNRGKDIFDEAYQCCINKHLADYGCSRYPSSGSTGRVCGPDAWAKPSPLPYGVDARNYGQYLEEESSKWYDTWLGCIDAYPEYYGPNGECEEIRAYRKCFLEKAICSERQRAAGRAFSDAFEQQHDDSKVCSDRDPQYQECFSEFRQTYCAEYWHEIQNFVLAAVKEGWLEYELVEEETGASETLYCKHRNCDDCDPSNPNDWIRNPLPPCGDVGVVRTQPDENQWWSDPLIG